MLTIYTFFTNKIKKSDNNDVVIKIVQMIMCIHLIEKLKVLPHTYSAIKINDIYKRLLNHFHSNSLLKTSTILSELYFEFIFPISLIAKGNAIAKIAITNGIQIVKISISLSRNNIHCKFLAKSLLLIVFGEV